MKHGADVNAQNTFGVTPLHWGARRGHHRVVAVLIQKGNLFIILFIHQ